MRVRRSAWLLFHCHDGRTLDIAKLLSGTLATIPQRRLYAITPAGGDEQLISRDELDVLLAVPGNECVDADGFRPELVQQLLDKSLLVTDEDERDGRLRASGWDRHAATYHFLTRWRGVDIRDAGGGVLPADEEHVRAFLEINGAPPSAFREVDAPVGIVDLPDVSPEGDLYAVLARRRTTRAFDESRPLQLDELAVILDQVFGCHGHTTAAGGVIEMLKRSSPSAGGLHPIEAFPLVLNVDGVEPGVHHYDAKRHTLELMEPIEREVAKELATTFVCGQTYFGSAHVLLLLVARFARTHWKYRGHQKAYASVLLDAGHLSQTLYLVAADRGLGAFVTTVINNAEIDERLGLDGIDEGVVAACGVGVPGERSPYDPEFRPFVRG